MHLPKSNRPSTSLSSLGNHRFPSLSASSSHESYQDFVSLSNMTDSSLKCECENRIVKYKRAQSAHGISRRRPQTALSSSRPHTALSRRPQTSISYKIQSDKRSSPFLVDLVAENERIDEENRVRRYRQKRKVKELERKREEAKNAIILRALQEANELDVLRREKRKILEEEKRLKAMIEIEKLNAQRKEDRIKAERAERKRKVVKTSERVEMNKAILDNRAKAERNILRVKLNIEDPQNKSFR